MNKELTEKLFNKYPELYEDRFLDAKLSNMYLGFLCGDGWYELIDNLSYDLMSLSRYYGVKIYATYVKEKFGGLRFHIRSGDMTDSLRRIVNGIIQSVEHRSFHVCEFCGEWGELREDLDLLRTTCDDCHRAYNKLRDAELEEIRRRCKIDV